MFPPNQPLKAYRPGTMADRAKAASSINRQREAIYGIWTRAAEEQNALLRFRLGERSA